MRGRDRTLALTVAALLPLAACGGGTGADSAAEGATDTADAARAAEDGAPAEERPAAAPDDGDVRRDQTARTEPEGAPARRTAEPRAANRQPAGERAPATEAAGEPPAPEEPPARVRTVPAGTQIWATLDDSLDTETAGVGDRFTAEVTSPVTDGAYVLLPTGTRLLGRLTRVRKARRDSAAMIAVAFDSVRVRDRTLPLEATVTDVKIEERKELKGEGKKIGLGAAAGAVVGAVVGKDVKGAIIGAAGGAAAGTGVALGTRARYAVLPAGSEVTLELDEALEVPLPSE